MSLWRRTHSEVAGAWRSLRYDLDRRTDERAESLTCVPDTHGRDVTSTGMSTFGGPIADELSTGYTDDLPRRPRRLLAVSAFGVLAVVGAAGSYFAVVNGLGSLLSEKPAAAEAQPYPLTAERPPAGTSSTAGLGRGTAPALKHRAPAPARVAGAAPAAVPTLDPPRPHRAAPRRTATVAGPTSCDCVTPPVPTPTAPSGTPSGSASPSPSASAPESPSASPSPSDSTSSLAEFRRKRHARGY